MVSLVEQIDALLPQTQCGQCGHGACLPYAKAMANQNEAINRCPPGGVKTLVALASLLERDAKPYLAEMAQQTQAPAQAFIRAEECIGCTKCIQACPVDAIIGSAKQLHTVITTECTGCGLCVEPCPVDCIDMEPLAMPAYQPTKARQRFKARQARLAMQGAKTALQSEADRKKAYIQAAIARAKAKKQGLK